MSDNSRESNVYKVLYDEKNFFINFAYVDKFREGLQDEEVEDIKTIKVDSKFFGMIAESFLAIAAEYENKFNTKILSDEDVSTEESTDENKEE